MENNNNQIRLNSGRFISRCFYEHKFASLMLLIYAAISAFGDILKATGSDKDITVIFSIAAVIDILLVFFSAHAFVQGAKKQITGFMELPIMGFEVVAFFYYLIVGYIRLNRVYSADGFFQKFLAWSYAAYIILTAVSCIIVLSFLKSQVIVRQASSLIYFIVSLGIISSILLPISYLLCFSFVGYTNDSHILFSFADTLRLGIAPIFFIGYWIIFHGAATNIEVIYGDYYEKLLALTPLSDDNIGTSTEKETVKDEPAPVEKTKEEKFEKTEKAEVTEKKEKEKVKEEKLIKETQPEKSENEVKPEKEEKPEKETRQEKAEKKKQKNREEPALPFENYVSNTSSYDDSAVLEMVESNFVKKKAAEKPRAKFQEFNDFTPEPVEEKSGIKPIEPEVLKTPEEIEAEKRLKKEKNAQRRKKVFSVIGSIFNVIGIAILLIIFIVINFIPCIIKGVILAIAYIIKAFGWLRYKLVYSTLLVSSDGKVPSKKLIALSNAKKKCYDLSDKFIKTADKVKIFRFKKPGKNKKHGSGGQEK